MRLTRTSRTPDNGLRARSTVSTSSAQSVPATLSVVCALASVLGLSPDPRGVLSLSPFEPHPQLSEQSLMICGCAPARAFRHGNGGGRSVGLGRAMATLNVLLATLTGPRDLPEVVRDDEGGGNQCEASYHELTVASLFAELRHFFG